MLTHLRLQNFKSWRDTGDIVLRPITAIYGANSSGKSALIQSLLLLKQTAEATDRNLTFHFAGPNTRVDLGDFASVVHQHDTVAAIELSLDWESARPLRVRVTENRVERSTSAGFCVRADQPTSTTVTTQLMTYRVGGAKFGMQRQGETDSFELFAQGNELQFEPRRDGTQRAPLPRPIKCYGFPEEVRFHFRGTFFLSDLTFALEECLRNLHYLGPLRAQPQRDYRWSGARPTDVGPAGELAVDAVLGSRKANSHGGNSPTLFDSTLEQRVSDLFGELGLLHEFRVEQIGDNPLYQVKVKQSETGPEALITDVGFGVSQILPVLVLCFYAPKGSTIILEQPEIHLHPAAQSALGDILIAARKRRNVQIIVESHSEHLLRRLQRRIAEETLPQSDLGVYFCENDGAESKLITLELDPYGNIKNWPEHFFGDDFGEIAAISKAELQRRMGVSEK